MANLVSDRSLESLRSVFDYPFTLIDVGAAGGVNRRYWKNFRNLTVVGFEPDEREFSKLQQSEGQRWYQIALNSSDGVFDLNVTRHQTNTSLLEPNIELVKQLSLDVRDFDIIRKVPLRCQTLDRVCADHDIVPHVVKLDTQGTELDILKGGEACLRRSIFAIEAEVEFLPLYKKQPLFTDVHEYVSGLGFQLMGFLNPVRIRGRECGDGRGASSHLLSSDALYFKSARSNTKCNIFGRICCMGNIYTQLSLQGRTMIHTQLERGLTPAAIARGLNRSASTLPRELRRNGWTRPTTRRGPGRPLIAGGYRATAAQTRAQACTGTPRAVRRLQPGTALWDQITRYLKASYSLE